MAGRRHIRDAYWRRHLERTAEQFGERHAQCYAYGGNITRAGRQENKRRRRLTLRQDDYHLTHFVGQS